MCRVHPHRAKFSLVVIGLAAATGVEYPTSAATVSWIGPAVGDWSTAGNWSSKPSLPSAGDDVTIGAAGVALTNGTATVRSVTSGGSLSITGPSATLILNGDSSVAGPFTLGSTASWPNYAGLESSGHLVLNGGGTWAGGRMRGTGKTTVAAGTTFAMNVTGETRLADGYTLENAGTLNLSGGSWEMLSATLDNLPGAVLNATIAANGAPIYGTVDVANLNNGGTLNKLGAGNWEINVRFNNAGTLNLTSGGITLRSSGTHAGTFNVSPGATLAFMGGTHTFAPSSTFNGSITLGDWQSSPVLKFTGDNVLPAGFNWVNGKLAGAGTTTVPAGQSLTMGAGGMDGRTLANAGTVNVGVVGGQQTQTGLTNSGAITNLAGATFNIQNTTMGGDAGCVFNNAGVVNVGGTASSIGAAVVNSGTINVNSGTLSLTGGGSYTGTIAAAIGAKLDFNNGTHVLFPSATITGAGKVRLSNSATLQVNGDNVFTNFEWTGGTLSGPGKTTIPAGATLAIVPVAEIYGRTPELTGRTLENAGTITLGPAGGWQNWMTLRTGAAINNLAGASFTITDASLSAEANTAFNNAGTVNASGTTSSLGVKFNNSGTLNVTSGTLTMGGGGTHTGTINLSQWTTTVFSAGTHVFYPSAAITGAGTMRLSGSAVLQFNGDNVLRAIDWAGGTISGSGKSTVPAGTSLAITPVFESGGKTPELSGRTLENAGSVTVSTTSWANSLTLSNGAVIRNLAGGTFTVADANLAGGTFYNDGTVVGGGQAGSIGATMFNAGTLSVGSGVMSVSAGGNYTGTINAAAFTTVSFTGGTHVFFPTATFTGEGTVRLTGGAVLQFNGDNTLGKFEWTGGTVTGPGRTTIPAGATVSLTPAYQSYGTTPILSARTLDNAGTINLNTSSDNWTLNGGAVLNNLAGATFSITNASVASTAGTAFNNAGTINAGGTSGTLGVVLNNTGTLNVQTGTTLNVTALPAQFVGGALTAGTWKVGAFATLNVTPGSNLTTIGPAAAVTLDGPNSSFAKINGLSAVDGAFSVTGGRSFTTAGALTNTGALTVGTGSLLKLAGPMTSTGTLTLAGTLDLVQQTLTTVTPADSLRQWLAAGRVISSAAGSPNQRVGYAPNAQGFLVVKRVTAGDANLDGVLSADDFVLLDRGLAGGGTVWWLGDFNYDGAVTSADALLIDAAYLAAHPGSPELLAEREAQFAQGYVGQLLASVPEPGVATAALIPVLFLRRRRRRA